MSFLPRHPLHTLVQSKLFMATGTKQLMLSCFAGSTAAVLLPRRLLHLPSHAHFINKNRLVLLSGTLRSRPRSTGLRCVAPIMTRSTVHMEPEVSKKLEQLKKRLEGQGIYYNAIPGQHTHLMCPKCNGGQSKKKSLALNIREDGEQAMWFCFRDKCGWRGRFEVTSTSSELPTVWMIKVPDVRLEGDIIVLQLSGQSKTNRSTKTKKYSTFTEESLQLEPLCLELVEYFSARKISSETLRRNAVMQRISYEKEVIAFTYKREGTLVNCKYRDRNKKFWQEKDAEKILYGLDDIKRAKDIIIVEGEIDKLSMEEAGFLNCVSVPNGAPAKVSTKLPDEKENSRFEYLWNCKSYFEKASRIIIATDADSPGQALAEELARRLGKERCWRVEWPKNNDGSVCKDANEVLMYLGPDALREVINNAEIYPIRGLFKFSDFFQEIDSYYKHSFGDELWFSTGWKSVANFYKVVPGELTVVTGVPNSGKSEWIDAIICNINRSQGWKFALCSMENKVCEHARKLLEKHVRKPFFNASNSVERMSIEEFEQGKQWLNDTFHLIRCEDDSLPSIQWVLSLAKAAVLRYGVRGLVIDPYNELDHQRHLNQTETEYVSQILTKIKRFAQHHSCHVWFVAHSKQLQNWGGGAPNMYDISGSAHLINKCDNGIVVHRNRDKDAGPLDRVQICVRRVRNKVVGSVGDAFLSYNRCEDDSLPSIQWVLSLAKAAVLRYGVRGLVIDPYNELDHQRHLNQTETEYVSQILTKIKRFAQHHSCHVWFVAHSKQLQNWGGGAPNMYDISGSAHLINKCDNGIVVHRNRDKDAGPLDRVQICVRRVRNKVVGSVGDAFLSYNRITGEYEDIDGPSKTF